MKKQILLFTFLLSFTAMAQWELVSEYTGRAMAVVNEDKVFVAHEDGIIYSTFDGGETWSSYQVEGFAGSYSWFNDIYFPTENVGYACGGSYYGLIFRFVIKTTDGGQTWQNVPLPSSFSYAYRRVYFIDETIGFLIGPGGGFWKTEDGGNTYTVIPHENSSSYVQDIFFTPDNVGYASVAVYESGEYLTVIQKSLDYGNSWATLTEPLNYHLKLFFIDDNNGYAISGYPDSRFLKTTDGGTTWTEKSAFIEPYLSALWFTSQNVGYTNINQRIYKTQNGGQTWTAQDIGPEPDGNIRKIAFANENVGFALGTDGIYRTTNGGGLETDSFSENHLKIYPNPAHEKINLEYDNNLNIQKIQLLDMSGKIIKTYLERFEVLDIQDLSKGNYILKIFSDKGVQTEKIVIK